MSSKRPINRPPTTLNAHRRVRTSTHPPKTAYEYFHVPLMGSYCEQSARGGREVGQRRARKRGFNFLGAHEQNDVPGGRLLPTFNVGDNIRSPRVARLFALKRSGNSRRVANLKKSFPRTQMIPFYRIRRASIFEFRKSPFCPTPFPTPLWGEV